MAQMGQLYLCTEIEALNGVAVAKVERERSAVHVVALQRRIGECRDLRDERVGPYEPGERVAELQPLLVLQRLVAGLAGAERGVGGSGAFRLRWLAPSSAGIAASISSGRSTSKSSSRRRVSHRMFGSVGGATVQPWNCSNASTMSSVSFGSRARRCSLERMDAVQPRQRLHRRQPDQHLVHVHRLKQRLVEPGLELLGHDQHPVVRPANSSAVRDSGKPFMSASINGTRCRHRSCRRRRRACRCPRTPSRRCTCRSLLVADGMQANDVTTIAFASPPIALLVC